MWPIKQADQALRQYGQRPVAKTGVGKMWDQVIEKIVKVMCLKHLSLNTEKTYTTWSRQFQLFIKGTAPSDLTTDDIKKFLFYLAVERKITASTQNQAGKKRGIPVISSVEEIRRVF